MLIKQTLDSCPPGHAPANATVLIYRLATTIISAMSRPLRLEYEQAVHHVTARGNQCRAIFRDDTDRQCLLDTLAQAAQRFGVVVHAYCLMPNHYHLLVQTPRANLSRAMAWVQTTYSMRYNRRHHRSGHLFQGRFKAQIVEADEYARQLLVYIHLNPVRPRNKRQAIPADRRRTLDAYRFSSHRVYAGLAPLPPGVKDAAANWLCTEWLSYFGRGRAAAQQAYRQEIASAFGQPAASPWADLRGGLVLGSQIFYETIKARLDDESNPQAMAWTQRRDAEQLQAAVAELAKTEADPRVRIWLRVQVGGEMMSALARELGYANGSGVARVVERLEAAAQSGAALRKKLSGLRRRATA